MPETVQFKLRLLRAWKKSLAHWNLDLLILNYWMSEWRQEKQKSLNIFIIGTHFLKFYSKAHCYGLNFKSPLSWLNFKSQCYALNFKSQCYELNPNVMGWTFIFYNNYCKQFYGRKKLFVHLIQFGSPSYVQKKARKSRALISFDNIPSKRINSMLRVTGSGCLAGKRHDEGVPLIRSSPYVRKSRHNIRPYLLFYTALKIDTSSVW